MMSEGPRGPKLFDADDPTVVPSSDRAPDPEARADGSLPGAPGAAPVLSPAPWFGWGGLLVTALLSLAMLSAVLWFERFVSVALQRDDLVGWIATGLLAFAVLAAVILIGREIVAIIRLARIGRLRHDAEQALRTKDRTLEAATIRRVRLLIANERHRDWDIARFREEERHMRKPGELMRLADRVLLAGADKEARRIVFESARRVATVSAMIPIAGLVVLFVLRENIRMLRRLAAAYGARPGFAGGLRLMWRTISYVAATGLVAFTDDLLGQFLGQDILRRLSRRLGEGAFNAALTARLGSAAVAVCRPLPFIEAPPIRARDVVSELFAGAILKRSEPQNAPKL